MDGAPTFAADAMLGRLARWLRLLGHDCTYVRDISDERLIEVARAQGRVVLTRDRRVAAKAARALYVPPGDLEDELATVCLAFSLTVPEEPPVSRCSVCNALLLAADPSALEPGALPAHIVEEGLAVWRCPQCARLYWRGTHVDSMVVRLQRLRGRLASGAAGAPPLDRLRPNS